MAGTEKKRKQDSKGKILNAESAGVPPTNKQLTANVLWRKQFEENEKY